MKIYRMHRLARRAEDYTGAMLAGGRWNSIDTPMLYAAQYLSLACVEILVHLDKRQLPMDYVWSSTELEEVPRLLSSENIGDVTSCQEAGDLWIRAGNELAAQVPSIVVPQ